MNEAIATTCVFSLKTHYFIYGGSDGYLTFFQMATKEIARTKCVKIAF